MSAKAPAGIGMFVWQWFKCEGGSPAAIAAKAKRSGLSWLAVHDDNYLTPRSVDVFHQQGLYVATWSYCVPGDMETRSFIGRAEYARNTCKVDAVLPDCEIEWESRKDADGHVHPSDRRPEAIVFAKQLRDALGPDCFIGNAGAWQWPDRHPVYPDHAFGAQWDAGLPERYFTMFSPTEPPKAALDESEREWARPVNAGAYKKIIPIGSVFDGKAQGGQALKVEDVAAFLDRQPDCALWSFQHCPNDVWAMLEQRAAAKKA